jgi:hypothetical protein
MLSLALAQIFLISGWTIPTFPAHGNMSITKHMSIFAARHIRIRLLLDLDDVWEPWEPYQVLISFLVLVLAALVLLAPGLKDSVLYLVTRPPFLPEQASLALVYVADEALVPVVYHLSPGVVLEEEVSMVPTFFPLDSEVHPLLKMANAVGCVVWNLAYVELPAGLIPILSEISPLLSELIVAV